MTNYEHYKDEIRHMAENRCYGFAVEKETYNLHPCALFPCDKCLFNSNKERISCNFLMLDWANQTYKRTYYKKLFSDDIPDVESFFLSIICGGYIARDLDGTLRYFENHPRWNHSYWFDEANNITLIKKYFYFIKPGECYLFDKNMESNDIKIIDMTGELRP